MRTISPENPNYVGAAWCRVTSSTVGKLRANISVVHVIAVNNISVLETLALSEAR